MTKPPKKPEQTIIAYEEPPDDDQPLFEEPKTHPKTPDQGDEKGDEKEPVKEPETELEGPGAPPPQVIPPQPQLMPRPPSNVVYPQITAGIVRNMMLDIAEPQNVPQPDTRGGGDLNGSANQSNLLGHSGTTADRLGTPRQNIKAGGGNYCGIV